VIFGGQSPEHEVSVMSAASIIDAIDRKKYSVETIWIDRDGHWFKGIRPAQLPDKKKTAPPISDIITELGRYEVVFPALHGHFGEDGAIQGIFEMAQIPYVGADVLSAALVMDKAMTKTICAACGIPVVEGIEIDFGRWSRHVAEVEKKIISKIGFPCFVKSSTGGSSIGTSKVSSPSELGQAIELAFLYSRRILIEKAVDAREIECGLLGNNDPAASICGEIRTINEFYDYEAKYCSDKTELIIPADIPQGVSEQIQSMALEAFRALRCRGMARADFFLDKTTGRLYLNELNTIPGFTAMSMYPLLWQAGGLSYSKLLDRLICLGLEAGQKIQKPHKNRSNKLSNNRIPATLSLDDNIS